MAEQEGTHFVEIVQYDGGDGEEKVIERRGPFSERRAGKIDDGLNINLNHDAFFTRVVTDAKVES